MKKTVLSFLTLLFTTALCAQNIVLNSPILMNRTSAAGSYSLRYSIVNHNSAEIYDVTISDNLEGTALQGVDYTLAANPYHRPLGTFNNVETIPITLPLIEICNTPDKTIILHVSAIPQTIGHATINTTFTLIIHRTDRLTDAQKKGCRGIARQSGTTWPTNNGGIDINFDTTNNAKLEFISYTDFKGFDADQPNGLAQTQFLFKWPLVRQWQVNNPNFKLQVFRSLIFPNLLFNRIDKTTDFVLYKPRKDSADNNGDGIIDSFWITSKTVNSFDLLKYSNFVANAKVNFLTLKFKQSRLIFDWEYSLYRMRVDTTKLTIGLDPVYATSTGLSALYECGLPGLSDAFQLRSTLGFETMHVWSNTFAQVDEKSTLNPQADLDNKIKPEIINKSRPMWSLSARLSRSISKDDKSELFFRYNVFWQRLKDAASDEPIKHPTNIFSQFQLGVQLTINAFGQQ